MDDKRARRVATTRKVKLFTTAEVVVLNIQHGRVTLAEADEFIELWKNMGEFPMSVKSFSDLI
jgi:hypothetical protein